MKRIKERVGRKSVEKGGDPPERGGGKGRAGRERERERSWEMGDCFAYKNVFAD